jgi:hypothetical protein
MLGASLISFLNPEDGDNAFLAIVDELLSDHTASSYRRK